MTTYRTISENEESTVVAEYTPEYGRELAGVLPPMSRFAKDGQREKKKETVLEKLKAFFTRFKDLASGMMKM